MLDWLKPLLMMFYAPVRAMGLVRDRAPLGIAALVALAAHAGYGFYTSWPGSASASGVRDVLLLSVWSLLCVALFFVPLTILVANLFERRASFGMVVQQEYAALASGMLYSWAAASLAALPLALLSRATGLEAQALEAAARVPELKAQMPPLGEEADPRVVQQAFAMMAVMLLSLFLSPLPLFLGWAVVAVREVFRISWLRSVLVVLLGGILTVPAMFLMLGLFSTVFASPFLLLLMFFLLRGYFSEVRRTQRARASFRQNLEAATLNPADASAHYNLGLIHLQRKELDEAKERFARAVEIDADEVDAHFQLGRIHRMQNDLAGAISRFEQVVSRDDAHSQHEVWREIGATYLAAAQYADAYDALARFLERRQSDPEGLYLMGRALSGMGRTREAADSMRACIEAVKTAPAYKYRAEKRWLNEAQQFLRTQA
ncbi:MAG TPA: tetratricopeptide repeat protein [Pyrinomonadaceae bacterium]|nr:tetratricopeptide repeat protein [Pyrinomonadaceae bacterium]